MKKERKGTFRSKLLVILNVFMLFALVAVPTYAFFWSRPATSIGNVEVGLGVEETLTITSADWESGSNGKVLIPPTATKTNINEVYELVYIVELEREGFEPGSYDSMLVTSHQVDENVFNVGINYDGEYGVFSNKTTWVVTITLSFVSTVNEAEFDNLTKLFHIDINFELVYQE